MSDAYDEMAALDQVNMQLIEENKKLREENSMLVEALQKIDEPMKYHHWEDDPYTRAGCFQFVAHEALKKRHTSSEEK